MDDTKRTMREIEAQEKRSRPVLGGGHTIRQATRPAPARYPCEDAVELISTVTRDDGGSVYPAKPLRPYAPDLWQRLSAAWLVLRGDAAAVRWLSHD